jgi:uncharacterized membrane protein
MTTTSSEAHPARWASTVGGAVLVVWGANRVAEGRAPLGAVLAATGAGLIWRAQSDDTRVRLAGRRGIIVEQAVAINRTPYELYAFWSQFERLPTIMPELRAVQRIDSRRSRWIVNGPARWRITWIAEIINDVPNELIAWRTTRGSAVVSAGSIHFTADPLGRGTVVRVKLQYDPPGRKLGAAVAWAFGDTPEPILREGLRRFKQLMETGEIATSAGQPRGTQ